MSLLVFFLLKLLPNHKKLCEQEGENKELVALFTKNLILVFSFFFFLVQFICFSSVARLIKPAKKRPHFFYAEGLHL